VNASEPRKVTGADGPTGAPTGRQGGTQPASDPSDDIQAARVETVARAMLLVEMEELVTDPSSIQESEVDEAMATIDYADMLRKQAAAALAVSADDGALAEAEFDREIEKALTLMESALDSRDAAIAERDAQSAAVLALADDADEVWRIHQAMTNHSAHCRPCESGARKKFADRLRALVTTDDRATIERVKGEAAAVALVIEREEFRVNERRNVSDGRGGVKDIPAQMVYSGKWRYVSQWFNEDIPETPATYRATEPTEEKSHE